MAYVKSEYRNNMSENCKYIRVVKCLKTIEMQMINFPRKIFSKISQIKDSLFVEQACVLILLSCIKLNAR